MYECVFICEDRHIKYILPCHPFHHFVCLSWVGVPLMNAQVSSLSSVLAFITFVGQMPPPLAQLIQTHENATQRVDKRSWHDNNLLIFH